MSDKSKIEWTDATWNPVRGCTKVSPGCVHCYAETFAERFRGVPGHPFEFGFDLRLVPEKLGDPLRWRAPRLVFVNSMSDLFHDGVPDHYVTAVAKVMSAANWHTFQVLTKRAERLAGLLEGDLSFAAQCRNIWALVRGCGQAYALQTVEPVTSRCGTRRVCQARSSGSERYTRARPHAVAPMNCVPEDSRRRSTCTGRTHSPRARADGNQTPSSTVAGRAPSPS